MLPNERWICFLNKFQLHLDPCPSDAITTAIHPIDKYCLYDWLTDRAHALHQRIHTMWVDGGPWPILKKSENGT